MNIHGFVKSYASVMLAGLLTTWFQYSRAQSRQDCEEAFNQDNVEEIGKAHSKYSKERKPLDSVGLIIASSEVTHIHLYSNLIQNEALVDGLQLDRLPDPLFPKDFARVGIEYLNNHWARECQVTPKFLKKKFNFDQYRLNPFRLKISKLLLFSFAEKMPAFYFENPLFGVDEAQAQAIDESMRAASPVAARLDTSADTKQSCNYSRDFDEFKKRMGDKGWTFGERLLNSVPTGEGGPQIVIKKFDFKEGEERFQLTLVCPVYEIPDKDKGKGACGKQRTLQQLFLLGDGSQ